MGSMTCVASPPAIFGCACRIPSKIHSTPNPVRSSHRPRGSAAPSAGVPAFPGDPAVRQVRAVAHRSQRNASMRTAIAPWCSRADLNAATRVGSLGLRPEFMPGTGIRLLSYLPDPKGSASRPARL